MDSATQKMQKIFTAHMRNPAHLPAPANIEDRRLQIYRDLIYNNIENFIANGFPVLRKIYDDTHWHSMVRKFVHQHQSNAPYFLELGTEFLNFLQNEYELTSFDPPFLFELARYERAELSLFVAKETFSNTTQSNHHDLLNAIPSMSPLAWLMVFAFPVHQIGPNFIPSEPLEAPVCLVVYRNRKDQVHFLEANAVTARLLELCEGNVEHKGEALLMQIAAEMNHSDPATVVRGGHEILAQLQSLDIILF